MPVNTAAWLDAVGARLEVRPAPYPTPRGNEIVVKNHAVAINPIDWILQITAIGFPWIKMPFVLGSDLAGEVVETGADVTRFKIGDRVLGHAVGTDKSRNSAAEGAFASYTVLLATMATPIPSDLSYERATVLPLALSTAACGLFQKDFLALDHPSLASEPNGKILLIWGGSTSVGSCAIQLAVAAGYDVITTCSPKNFAYVKKLGAIQAFDYNDANAVRDIASAFGGKRCAGAYAIGPGSALACADVIAACSGNKFVALATYPITFDESNRPAIFKTLATMRQFIGFSIVTWWKSQTRGVRSKFVFGSSLINNEVGGMIYEDFLPRALAEGRIVPAPDPNVIGTGLESIQAGLDIQKRGVSASKVVVLLD